MNFQDFLRFDKMLTPTIIKIVFWIGVVISVLVGLGTIMSGLNSPWGGGFQVIMGLLTIAIGPIIVRIYCELLIIFFKMHETLHDIKGLLSNQPKATTDAGATNNEHGESL